MLKPSQIRLSDADREEYGGPEWLDLDPTAFTARRVSVLSAWERECGVKVIDLVTGELDVRAMETLRVMAWYARKLAGLDTAWSTFDPHILEAQMRHPELPEAADVDPPAQSSPESSTDEVSTTG